MFSGFLLAGAGGFLGAGLRYLFYQGLSAFAGAGGYVWATFVVNILGSFLIGCVSPLWLSPQHPARIFVVVGVLGGFTTFSSFSSDMLHLLSAGRCRCICRGQRQPGLVSCLVRFSPMQ